MNLLDDIREAADALTEPSIHRAELPREWDHNRHRKPARYHQTVQPGLLTQLYQSIHPAGTTDPGARGIPASRPPLALEALSTYGEICMRARAWCRQARISTRVTVESTIRALVGAAGHLDDDQLHQLRADLRQWRRWCLVQTGWEQIRIPRGGVACPIVGCGRIGTLRINLTTASAMCRACGAAWSEDDGSIGVLAAHVEAYGAGQRAG
jgi:hypothetical protein